MIKTHIFKRFQSFFEHEPTKDQLGLMDALSDFVANPRDRSAFIMNGYAGTGKTTVITALVKMLENVGLKSVLMAPTGRAAKVIHSYSGHPAFTIHKVIYRQQSAADSFSAFALNFNKMSNTFFIVDEASMISNQTAEKSSFGSGNLLTDLVEFVYSGFGCRLILVGDAAQLPPVGENMSAALMPAALDYLNVSVSTFTLKMVVRQNLESGIYLNATKIRNSIVLDDSSAYAGGKQQDDEYDEFDDEEYEEDELELNEFDGFTLFPDVKRIAGNEITEEIANAYARYGMNETLVICKSNKRAYRYNMGIRNHILGRESEIESGDLVMVVKNNYFWLKDNPNSLFIANGDILRIKRIRNFDERYGFRFADATLVLEDLADTSEIDAKVLLSTLASDGAAMSYDEMRSIYSQLELEYAEIQNKKQRMMAIRNDPYFNAIQIKYAYAVTCHKAQGGQWNAVFVDRAFALDELLVKENLRWLYTAVTRATSNLYLVNYDDEYFV